MEHEVIFRGFRLIDGAFIASFDALGWISLSAAADLYIFINVFLCLNKFARPNNMNSCAPFFRSPR